MYFVVFVTKISLALCCEQYMRERCISLMVNLYSMSSNKHVKKYFINELFDTGDQRPKDIF